MAKTVELTIRPSIVHRRKTLFITPQFVEWGNHNFSKFEIAELRYGVTGIQGYRFTIGRVYHIHIKSLTGSILIIQFISLYRIRKAKLDEKYRSILNALFENFMNDMVIKYLNDFHNKIDFTLLGVAISQGGLQLNNKFDVMPWSDVGTKSYWHHCTLFSKKQPGIYKVFTYLVDWNTIVLYTLVRRILREKDLLEVE